VGTIKGKQLRIPPLKTELMRKFKFNDGGRGKHFPSKYKSDQTNDCSIRAIAIATNQDYIKVMSEQFWLGLKIGRMPNDDKVVEAYLKTKGFVKQKTLKNGSRKYTVKDFPKSEVILRVHKHLVYVSSNTIHDIWDCSKKAVGVWYVK
tara:strand:+ start:415 stop:858 length:444 start_codon:yes stop_codon:yes gene_type:complete